MRHLVLLRHAEAEPARAGQADAERSLTERGRTEALDAAQCILDAGLRIDTMLVSTAVRTRETAVIVAAQLDIFDGFIYEPTFYLAAPDALLSGLHLHNPASETVLIVGHNPGLSELATQFISGDRSVQLHTGGLCQINFDDHSWLDIAAGNATSVSVLR